ncbi:MAG: helix-turn-helix transcriptional regulator [Treponema sp.]|nr:helix-turn-helix transcriptional regulator [Treponema sp.]
MISDSLRSRLSRNLKRLRRQRNLTQLQLAELSGLSEHTLNSIESRRMWASDSTLQKMCAALGVDAVSLFLPCGDISAQKEKIRGEMHRLAVLAFKDIVEQELKTIV